MIRFKHPLILIGFKHAGKSVIGAALAKALKTEVVDLDLVIQDNYFHQTGQRFTCRQIAQEEGLEYFRVLESKTLNSVFQNIPPILSVGGGTPLSSSNRDLLAQGTVIWVKAPQGRIFERIMINGRPAFFPEGEDAYEAFIRIWEEREPLYHSLAQFTIQNLGTVEEAVESIISLLQHETHTQLNIVIGSPVKHSQSPALHRKIYDQRGINAVMVAIENPDLSDLVQSIKTLNIGLTAVTLPFKTQILEHVDVLSEEVAALHAANTLIYKNGLIHAHNTDVEGIKASLSEHILSGRSVLILGAGGAARACAYALKDRGASLFWLNRNASKAQALAEAWGGQVLESAQAYQKHFDLIINATPVGMSPNIQESPLPDYPFQPDQTIFDLIYTPDETRLLQEAKAAGAKIINGRGMFVEQAIKQVELWRKDDELYGH